MSSTSYHLDFFLARITTDDEGTVSIGGRNITNLRFADDIDGLAGEEHELISLINQLNDTSREYGMEISTEKTKIMTNNPQGFTTDVQINGKTLEAVDTFTYLGAIVSEGGSKQEILARIAQTTTALTRLKPIWKTNNISISSKVRLLRSLVMAIFLYACESWTLTVELERKINTFEMRCFRRLLGISYRDHIPNDEVKRRISSEIGTYVDLLTTIKRKKLKWYGHVTRSSGLSKTILQGTVNGSRRRGRQKKKWEDNVTEWTGLELRNTLRSAECRNEWREVVARSTMMPLRTDV